MEKRIKKIVLISLVPIILVLLIIFILNDKKEINNTTNQLKITDLKGKKYNDIISIDANTTINLNVEIKNLKRPEAYNYGLYYKVLSDKKTGITIGEEKIEETDVVTAQGSIETKNVIVPLKISNVSNEEKKIQLGVHFSKLNISYQQDEIKISNFYQIIPNEPKLLEGMIPIVYNEFNQTWVKASMEDWYDYDNKKWANAVMVTSNTRENYINAKVETPIKEEDILAYYVWIPRYKYKLFNTNFAMLDPQEIEIVFSTKDEIKSYGTQNGEWLTHPAFTFGDDELTGIWVGKFETTGTADNPTIKPNLVTLTNQNVSEQFVTSKKFISENYISEKDIKTSDSHVAKNIEWGAVAYLSHSKYGICTDGICKKIRINNANALSGSLGPSITGCASISADDSTITTSTCNTSKTVPYNDIKYGVLASTTHSIYGIYDMNGGTWEYVMGVIMDDEGKNIISGSDNINNSGFSGIIYQSNSSWIAKGNDLPLSKYLDLYNYNVNFASTDKTKLGDATGETRGWHSDFKAFPDNNASWFMRGGLHYDHIELHSLQIKSGIFAYGNSDGRPSNVVGFRTILIN